MNDLHDLICKAWESMSEYERSVVAGKADGHKVFSENRRERGQSVFSVVREGEECEPGGLLILARLCLSLSVRGSAARYGIAYPGISNMENGKRVPAGVYMQGLADDLVSVYDLS